jgi:hypothetical protein
MGAVIPGRSTSIVRLDPPWLSGNSPFAAEAERLPVPSGSYRQAPKMVPLYDFAPA